MIVSGQSVRANNYLPLHFVKKKLPAQNLIFIYFIVNSHFWHFICSLNKYLCPVKLWYFIYVNNNMLINITYI